VLEHGKGGLGGGTNLGSKRMSIQQMTAAKQNNRQFMNPERLKELGICRYEEGSLTTLSALRKSMEEYPSRCASKCAAGRRATLFHQVSVSLVERKENMNVL